jgi:hypothetical protein
MRPWCIILLKLKHGARSGDLAPTKDGHGGLYRYFYPEDAKRAERQGLRGDYYEDDVQSVRWWRNKTIGQRHSAYSNWHHQGAFLVDSAQYPHMSAACPRRILNKYIEITDGLPRDDNLVFVSSTRSRNAAGRLVHSGISSQTVAKDAGAVMTLCGVPARFKPHSTRHVKLSSEREQARASGKGIDDALGKVDVSKKVFDLFYNQPFSTDKLNAEDVLPASRAPRPSLLADWAVVLSGADPAQPAAPPPAAPLVQIADEDEEQLDTYEVEAVVDERCERGVKFYKIKWRGFDDDHNTWEPVEHLDCSAAIAIYINKLEAAAAVSERRLARIPPVKNPALNGTASTSSNANVVAVYAERRARSRKAPVRFFAAPTSQGDCRTETAVVLTSSPTFVDVQPKNVFSGSQLKAARKLSRALSTAPKTKTKPGPTAKASKTRSKPTAKSNIAKQRRSSRVRTASGSAYAACPLCSRSVPIVMMGHHMDVECTARSAVP